MGAHGVLPAKSAWPGKHNTFREKETLRREERVNQGRKKTPEEFQLCVA